MEKGAINNNHEDFAIFHKVTKCEELCNPYDSSPIYTRSLEPIIEAQIVQKVKEKHKWFVTPRFKTPLSVNIFSDNPTIPPFTFRHAELALKISSEHYFTRLAKNKRFELLRLLETTIFLFIIGVFIFTLAFVLGIYCQQKIISQISSDESPISDHHWYFLILVLEELMIIGAWVIIWRPLDNVFYGWWPLVYEYALYRKIASRGFLVFSIRLREGKFSSPNVIYKSYQSFQDLPEIKPTLSVNDSVMDSTIHESQIYSKSEDEEAESDSGNEEIIILNDREPMIKFQEEPENEKKRKREKKFRKFVRNSSMAINGLLAYSPGDTPNQSKNIIYLHLSNIYQLYSTSDGGPLHERTISQPIEDYLLERVEHSMQSYTPFWSRKLPIIHIKLDKLVDKKVTLQISQNLASASLQNFFKRKAESEKISMWETLSYGMKCLVIGSVSSFLFTVLAYFAYDESLKQDDMYSLPIITQILLIGSWVILWRPFEILFFGWYNVFRNYRLFKRLTKVSIVVSMCDKQKDRQEYHNYLSSRNLIQNSTEYLRKKNDK